jgi:glutaconyl-CoA/methylmalonyl-CoA decarboxylase subunit gamma
MTTIQLIIDGESFTVEVGDVSQSPVTVMVNGVEKSVSFQEVTATATAPAAQAAPAERAVPAEAQAAAQPQEDAEETPAPVPVGEVSGEVIAAPMPGKILSITVNVGDAVDEGDAVCTLEAMKMEMPISATASGTVKAVHVRVGQNVANDDPLITVG